jgi:transposase InsO family protein
MTEETTFGDRVVVGVVRRRRLDPRALGALLKARELLALTLGLLLAKVRATVDPIQILVAKVKELEFMRSHVLSIAETAPRFLLSASTVVRWLKETAARPDRETVGNLIRPVPPVVRYADVCRSLIQEMDRMGLGGNKRIAQTLARVGWALSARTVGRIRKENPPTSRPPEPQEGRRCVKARYPNHVWLADITEIPGMFRIFSFKLAIVLDAFSRMPLAAKVYEKELTSGEMADLVCEAVERNRPCRHFVTDRGPQFTGKTFREVLSGLGVRHRFGRSGRPALSPSLSAYGGRSNACWLYVLGPPFCDATWREGSRLPCCTMPTSGPTRASVAPCPPRSTSASRRRSG